MLYMDYNFLLGAIENLLGPSKKKSKNNHAFCCPFCNENRPDKKKLEIQMMTTEEGKNFWECWVCKTRGQSIYSLLKQLKIPKAEAVEVLKFVKKGKKYDYKSDEKPLELPKEFQALATASQTSVIANQVKNYLYERGFSNNDFIKYNVGYCTAGEYGGRIILPSYTGSGRLNFFVARSYNGDYRRYRNPETSKDIIFFENLINWNVPIILCEGVFDAVAIRRNAIPVLGTNISKSLMKKIITSSLEDVYIALDKDAFKHAFDYCEKLISIGKRVFLLELQDKDPSELGFENFTRLVQSAEELTFKSLMRHKLEAL